MDRVPATAAKQNFGALIEAAGRAPVAVERHGRVVAVVMSSDTLRDLQRSARTDDPREARRQARLVQALIEKDRLIRHHHIALQLLTDRRRARSLMTEARRSVQRWRDRGLCSSDYIDRWEAVLALPPAEVALRIVGDLDGWGTALRQNSPWAAAPA